MPLFFVGVQLMSCFMRLCFGRTAALLVAVLALGMSPLSAQVVDDFSDLDDTANPAWTHLSGLIGSSGQTWDASTGQDHLVAPNNGLTVKPEQGALGYVASYVPTSFTDIIVSADFVQNTTGAAYGVLARTDGVEGINVLKGYAYAYEPFAGAAGEMTLFRITGANLSDIGNTPVTLDLANKDYTFSLEIVGDQLHGRVHEIGGGLVTEVIRTDATYTSGFSGVFGYSAVAAGVQTDYTIDNFSASEPAATPGDFNDDGNVDGDDLAIWTAEFGAVTNGADANGDGVTDGADFLVWQTHFTGSTPPSAVSAVPEPVALQLAGSAILIVAGYVRRRSVVLRLAS
jgi:hypothetical protein